MYVPKLFRPSFVLSPSSHTFFIVGVGDDSPRHQRIKLVIDRYPCGRVKITALFCGCRVTGKVSDSFKSVTFDSVKSLYNIPGFRVLTEPSILYRACGLRSYRVN